MALGQSNTRTRLARLGRQRRRSVSRIWALEGLESRCLLAASSVPPAIMGTVYQDLNNDSQPSTGEGLAGVTLRLYADDGDGVLEAGADDAQFGADLITDANGDYCFTNLTPLVSYFVVQPAQSVTGLALPEQVSALTSPTTPGILIDGFATTQSAAASPPAPSNSTSVITFANDTEVIGRERDLVAQLDSGDGEVRVSINPFNNRETLRYNSDVSVTGSGTIVWDGTDVDAGSIAMGLNGLDLTNGGTETGIVFQIGAAGAGATATVRLYQANDLNFSQASLAIPVTAGGAADSYEYIPFSEFIGPVLPTNVDAIELVLDSNASGANDIELSLIGANGPRTVNFATSPSVDLAVTKTDNSATAVPGQTLTYNVVVTNNGPSDVDGASIVDNVPATLLTPTYTSTVTGTASGNTASGSGNIADVVSLSMGSSITYTVTGTVAPNATGTISNTASVSPPDGLADVDGSNNNAIDIDNLVPTVDLAITKTDNVESGQPGRPVNYVITVTNDGPSDVVGATVSDQFPATLTGVTYTSSTTGTVSGNTAAGSGNISDTVSLSAGSSVVYSVAATIAPNATGAITNTATVTAPEGTTEVNTSNNTASDIDSLLPEVDLVISKTDGETTVEPNDVLNYTIVVRNDGPADAVGATVVDTFPAGLSNVSYTSSGTAGVTGNSASGSTNINDTVSLPAGSTLTYLVTATVASTASGSLTNTATITAPNGTTDTLLSNNTATDTDTVNPLFDLFVTKDDGGATIAAGQSTTYTIVVQNAGPSSVAGALVTDNFPAALTNVIYTSAASGGATGNTTSGSGTISDTVILPAGASITYAATGTLLSSASGLLTNTATVTAPAGQVEADTANNTATDTNTIIRQADLSVTKTDGRTTAAPGQSLSYQLIVNNNGPSDVTGATLTDPLPSSLSGGSYTSSAAGGATGNTNGVGSINDTLNLPAGSSVSYNLSATVAAAATGSVTNSATIAVPVDVTDTEVANNSATDTDTIEPIRRRISGYVFVDADDDGIFDANEAPIPGVVLTLAGTDVLGSAVARTVSTSASGLYEFSDLSPGTYQVTESQPGPYGDGRETVGTGSTTNVVATDNVFANIGLGDVEDAINFNFGETRSNISKRDLLASRFAE